MKAHRNRNRTLEAGLGGLALGLIPALLLLAGCTSEEAGGGQNGAYSESTGSVPSDGDSTSGGGGTGSSVAGAGGGAAGAGVSTAMWGSEGGDDFDWSGEPPTAKSVAGRAGREEIVAPAPVTPAGQLTAAEWNDLDNWDFFLGLLDEQNQEHWADMLDVWGFYPQNRIVVNVLNGAQPVPNAQVILSDAGQNPLWEARTDVDGRAELFVDLFAGTEGSALLNDLTITAAKEDKSHTVVVPAGESAPEYDIELDASGAGELSLDLMFMIDTTGSMSDELTYVQVELQDVIERVNQTAAQRLSVRLSVNFYRDFGDDYLVRAFPFTTDIDQSVAILAEQSANGGGDFPEAVDEALQSAVAEHEWDAGATCRLLFLVLDAPPHSQQAVLKTVRGTAAGAAAGGIQIIAVSASGIDKETEFLLRFLAMVTNGTYVFLTDDSGIGNPHLQAEPTIGEHEIELLNDLLVRVIEERLGLVDDQ